MDLKLLDKLRCPTCKTSLICHSQQTDARGRIIEGKLECQSCELFYPIIKSIPRFVSMENYASSFGYQWNLYKYTQVDKYSKIQSSEQRFYAETNWNPSVMKDNWIMEAGCGNGRFIEVSSRNECEIVGVDISSAIDAAGELYKDRANVHLVQASLYELPFATESFDKCYSIGVIQHTPNPEKSVKTLTAYVKKGGELALTIYERKPWTMFYSKYWFRPLTKRLNKKVLLFSIKLASVILFPLTEILFRIPILNKVFKFIIPYANYVEMRQLSIRQRYEWSVLDTFDMLSPAYDKPMTEKKVRKLLEEANVKNIYRLPNPGINIVGTR